MIPYGKQCIDNDDIQCVIEVLQSDWLTTGPRVDEFEHVFADFVGANYAVAVSSGTAALHSAIFALEVGPEDEVIVPAMTFAATANCIVFQGGTPVFADVKQDTLLIDPSDVEKKITSRTKAIIAVDFAGQPAEYGHLQKIAEKFNLRIIGDACHALGGAYKGQSVGSLADLNTFSFHPVKHITTGEGGMITTDNKEFALRMKMFRNHGIANDHRKRTEQGTWFYEMIDLGYNYRITDFQCALGMSQLKKLPVWVKRRQEIAQHYDKAFVDLHVIEPLSVRKDVSHAFHLYVIRLNLEKLSANRSKIFSILRNEEIGVNVHYIPVHLHPFYQKKFGTKSGLCPVAESVYEEILSLPIYPKMKEKDIKRIISCLNSTLCEYDK